MVQVSRTDGGNHGRLGVASQTLLQQPVREGLILHTWDGCEGIYIRVCREYLYLLCFHSVPGESGVSVRNVNLPALADAPLRE